MEIKALKLLLIDNTRDADSVGSGSLRRALHEANALLPERGPLEIHTRRGPESDLPSAGDQNGLASYDGVVISGSRTSCLDDSPWVSELLGYLRDAVAQDLAVLGVCFGHQMLARAFDGLNAVGAAAQPEYGWTEIERTGEDPLFDGLPPHFWTFSVHREEVRSLPASFNGFARSEACGSQAFRIKGKRAWGIQFHPERNLEEAKTFFDQMKKEGKGRILLRASEGSRLYQSTVGQTIFGNFLKQVRG